MEYYLYRPDADNFAGIVVAPDQDEEMIDIYYDDRCLAETWRPVLFHGFDGNPTQEGDFPSLSNYNKLPVMSQRAWDVLRPFIGDCCEALPIIHPTGEQFYIIHVLETIDCLDEENSELRRSQIDGRVNRIMKYGFIHNNLQGKHIFKLPLKSGGELLVDDVFRKNVEGNSLKGLRFNELPLAEAPLSTS